MNRLVVCVVGGVPALIAVTEPDRMLALWPATADADLRLMVAWGLSTMALVAVLAGCSARFAVKVLCGFSILWDLSWGGTMGLVAAALNLICVLLL